MSFTDITFIARFLPIFLAVYYIAPNRWRDPILFIGSLIFYAFGEPRMVFMLLLLVIANYLMGRVLVKPRGVMEEGLPELDENGNIIIIPAVPEADHSAKRKAILILSVILDAGVLIFFKAGALIKPGQIMLPLGLSFYIFKMISYQADLYTGKIKFRPEFFRTAVYFTMFPQIMQGPIMRYSAGDFETAHGRIFSFSRFEEGLVEAVLGIGMKVLLADRIGILWNEITKIGYESISTPLAWMGAFAYTFQLYFDFWGYSLIASGLGMMLGFSEIINFDHPYAAKNIADFYRRWHATLGFWFRDYIYIPLGGSRVSKLKVIRNLLIVWAITGLWHGGTLNFLIWGLVLGIFIILEKFPLKKIEKRIPLLGHLAVWVIIPLTWVIFAIPNLHDLGVYFLRLFPLHGGSQIVAQNDWLILLKQYAPYFGASVFLCIPAVAKTIRKYSRNQIAIICFLILFWISMYFVVTQQSNSFMYFSF